MFDLNPLDVLHKRSLNYVPPHFTKFKLSEDTWNNYSSIENWIRAKLKGRYSIVKTPAIGKEGQLKTATFVAFEDQKELTYFMLACPHLRRN